jgi:uncharacterized protein (TIGR02246 family)
VPAPADPVTDELAIRHLVATYADVVCRMDPPGLRSVFAPDAVWEVTGYGQPRGHDEIVAFLDRLLSQWQRVVQLVHQGRVWLDEGGDTAEGQWYITEVGRMNDGTDMFIAGVYHDAYVRQPDGWRFARRRYDGLYGRRGDEIVVRDYPSVGARL